MASSIDRAAFVFVSLLATGCAQSDGGNDAALDDGQASDIGTDSDSQAVDAGETCSVDIDCQKLGTSCMKAQCVDKHCTITKQSNGTACYDGPACTANTTCTDGVCTGGDPKDCSGLTAECLSGVCDPDAGGLCKTTAKPDGHLCACVDGGTCSGQCSLGSCIAQGGSDASFID